MQTEQTNGTTALAIASHGNQIAPTSSLAFEPSDVQSAVNLAKVLVASRLLPRAVATPEAAFTIIMTGRELGLTAMQSIRSIHIIEGKPTMSADLMVALVKRSPHCKFFRLVESTGDVATYETQRVGEDKPTRLSWTIGQAKAAKLTGKTNWQSYPDAMLRSRSAAALCRAVYPDTMLGIYETDEIAPSAPIPEVPSSFSADDAELVDDFNRRIAGAATLIELEAVAPEIKNAGLGREEVAELKHNYGLARDRILKAAAETAQPAAAEDENPS